MEDRITKQGDMTFYQVHSHINNAEGMPLNPFNVGMFYDKDGITYQYKVNMNKCTYFKIRPSETYNGNYIIAIHLSDGKYFTFFNVCEMIKTMMKTIHMMKGCVSSYQVTENDEFSFSIHK